jgi:hypothetical protein
VERFVAQRERERERKGEGERERVRERERAASEAAIFHNGPYHLGMKYSGKVVEDG